MDDYSDFIKGASYSSQKIVQPIFCFLMFSDYSWRN